MKVVLVELTHYLGLGTTTAVSSTASGTARGLASQPAILSGKTSNEDLSKDFFFLLYHKKMYF